MSDATTTPMRVLTLPGWEGSGPDHWQTRWEAVHGDRRVEQHDWMWPLRGDWVARLEDVLLDSNVPALLVAHSLGCHLVAAWAAHSRHAGRVRAALLVAPPDLDALDALDAPQLQSWKSVVRRPLPFASTVVAGSNDPYAHPDRARALAADWGSDFIDAGPQGHLNAASGLGDWPQGRIHLDALLRRTAPRTTLS